MTGEIHVDPTSPCAPEGQSVSAQGNRLQSVLTRATPRNEGLHLVSCEESTRDTAEFRHDHYRSHCWWHFYQSYGYTIRTFVTINANTHRTMISPLVQNAVLNNVAFVKQIAVAVISVSACFGTAKANEDLLRFVYVKSLLETCLPPTLVWKYVDSSIQLEVYALYDVLQSTTSYRGVLKNNREIPIVISRYIMSSSSNRVSTPQFLYGSGCVNWMLASTSNSGLNLSIPARPGMRTSGEDILYTSLFVVRPHEVIRVHINEMSQRKGNRIISQPPFTMCNCIAYGIVHDSVRTQMMNHPRHYKPTIDEARNFDYKPHYDCGVK